MSLQLSGTSGVLDNSGAFIAGTAQASTSGTSIDFTSIPSWVKRVTVMFNGVSTNGSSPVLVQIGAGSVTSSGYVSSAVKSSGGGNTVQTSTAGFVTGINSSSEFISGTMTIATLGSNIWAQNNTLGHSTSSAAYYGGGSITLGGTLDRIRITTVNGTDTFDAGSINILYE